MMYFCFYFPLEDCDGNQSYLNQTEGSLSSPNYPNDYADDTTCSWFLITNGPDSGMGVAVTITDFATEASKTEKICIYNKE